MYGFVIVLGSDLFVGDHMSDPYCQFGPGVGSWAETDETWAYPSCLDLRVSWLVCPPLSYPSLLDERVELSERMTSVTSVIWRYSFLLSFVNDDL